MKKKTQLVEFNSSGCYNIIECWALISACWTRALRESHVARSVTRGAHGDLIWIPLMEIDGRGICEPRDWFFFFGLLWGALQSIIAVPLLVLVQLLHF